MWPSVKSIISLNFFPFLRTTTTTPTSQKVSRLFLCVSVFLAYNPLLSDKCASSHFNPNNSCPNCHHKIAHWRPLLKVSALQFRLWDGTMPWSQCLAAENAYIIPEKHFYLIKIYLATWYLKLKWTMCSVVSYF